MHRTGLSPVPIMHDIHGFTCSTIESGRPHRSGKDATPKVQQKFLSNQP